MIVVLKPGIQPEEIQRVVERIEGFGLRAHLSQGEERTIIGAIGDERLLADQTLESFPGVEKVLPILKPYKLVSREFQTRKFTSWPVPVRWNHKSKYCKLRFLQKRRARHFYAAALTNRELRRTAFRGWVRKVWSICLMPVKLPVCQSSLKFLIRGTWKWSIGTPIFCRSARVICRTSSCSRKPANSINRLCSSEV